MNEALHTEYFRRLSRAFSFIEENIFTQIEQVKIAECSGTSLYHFHRMFKAGTGDSLGDYIRKRKMSIAAEKLKSGDIRIIDLAVSLGYNSHASFTRAFSREYGCSPGDIKKNGYCFIMRKPKTIEQLICEYENRRQKMDVKIIEKKQMLIAGKKIRVNNGGENKQKIPMFWSEFMTKKLGERIPDRLCECYGTMGICINDGDEAGNFSYMIGDPVSSTDSLSEEFDSIIIEAGTWAVFTSKGPFPEAIQNCWDYIYSEWLPGSGYELRDSPEIELYDDRCSNDPQEMDIYLPVQKKN